MPIDTRELDCLLVSGPKLFAIGQILLYEERTLLSLLDPIWDLQVDDAHGGQYRVSMGRGEAERIRVALWNAAGRLERNDSTPNERWSPETAAEAAGLWESICRNL